MSLSKTSIVVMSIAALMCITCTVASAVQAPPSTDGWTLTPVIDGNSIQLLLGIDNSASLVSYEGEVSKTWGDSTLTDPSMFITLGDSGAILKYLTITLDGDPYVSVAFGVVNGSTAQSYLISAQNGPTLITPPMPNAIGTASAAITVISSGAHSAVATGGYNHNNGHQFFRALYNSLSASPQDFRYLIDGSVTAPPYLPNTAQDPVYGAPAVWQTISGPISDISAEFSFTLSANDSASGTGSFTVLPVPEPGSMLATFTGIVGLAGLAMRRRKA